MDAENKLNDAVINALSLLQRVHRLSGTVAILNGELIHANISQMKAFSSGPFTEAAVSIFDGFARRRRRAERVTFVFGEQNVLLVSGGPMIVGFFFDKISDLESVEAGIDKFLGQFGSALHMDQPAPDVEVVPLAKTPKPVVQAHRESTGVKSSVIPKPTPADAPDSQEEKETAHRPAKVSGPAISEALSRALVATLFAAGGFLSASTFLLFKEAGLWSGEASIENLHLISRWTGLAALCSIIPVANSSRLSWRGIAVFSFLNGGLIIPILGRWLIDGGWLNTLGYLSANGSSLLVAGVGAAALSLGIASRSSTENASPSMLLPLILLIGIAAFTVDQAFDAAFIQLLITTTAAGVTGLIIRPGKTNRPDPTRYLLAGIVAAIAGCGELSPLQAALNGCGAGLIAALASMLLSRSSITDETGLIPSFLFSGLWGTVFTIVAGITPWQPQLIGFGAIALATGAASFCIFQLLKLCNWLLVPEN